MASTAILHDGLAVAVVDNDPIEWFHRNVSSSMSHALEHEGYTLETHPDLVRGWQTFELYATRRGYGVAGSLARLAVELQRLVSAHEREYDSIPGQWRDYVAAPPIALMLQGFADSLQSSGNDAGSFDNIRGQLHAWALATAARIGEDLSA